MISRALIVPEVLPWRPFRVDGFHRHSKISKVLTLVDVLDVIKGGHEN